MHAISGYCGQQISDLLEDQYGLHEVIIRDNHALHLQGSFTKCAHGKPLRDKVRALYDASDSLQLQAFNYKILVDRIVHFERR
jgi:hypothetical protein